jgi:hypothetical protein
MRRVHRSRSRFRQKDQNVFIARRSVFLIKWQLYLIKFSGLQYWQWPSDCAYHHSIRTLLERLIFFIKASFQFPEILLDNLVCVHNKMTSRHCIRLIDTIATTAQTRSLLLSFYCQFRSCGKMTGSKCFRGQPNDICYVMN